MALDRGDPGFLQSLNVIILLRGTSTSYSTSPHHFFPSPSTILSLPIATKTRVLVYTLLNNPRLLNPNN